MKAARDAAAVAGVVLTLWASSVILLGHVGGALVWLLWDVALAVLGLVEPVGYAPLVVRCMALAGVVSALGMLRYWRRTLAEAQTWAAYEGGER